jgi:hypothetical protein
MGKSALILQVLCTCKISALNEKCTIGMLPKKQSFETSASFNPGVRYDDAALI